LNLQDPLWDIAGWFGKIPSLGDFVTRRLPLNFVEPWDEWLSGELYEAQIALGGEWQAAYQHAPIRCFTLGQGVIGGRTWHGLLAPSVDRVGRQFPLTIALSPKSAAASPPAREWWRDLLRVGRRALQPDGSADGVDDALVEFQNRQTENLRDQAAPAHQRPLTAVGDGTSTWWTWTLDCSVNADTADADSAAAVPMIFDGLPRGAGFIKLLALSESVVR
jgi:type VI secretion system ImpM family protein